MVSRPGPMILGPGLMVLEPGPMVSGPGPMVPGLLLGCLEKGLQITYKLAPKNQHVKLLAYKMGPCSFLCTTALYQSPLCLHLLCSRVIEMLYSRVFEVVCLKKLVNHSHSQAKSLRFDSFIQVCKQCDACCILLCVFC